MEETEENNYQRQKEIMPNYLEYQELFERFTFLELQEAHEALDSRIKQEELFKRNSPSAIFFFDTDCKEKLLLFFEDLKNQTK